MVKYENDFFVDFRFLNVFYKLPFPNKVSFTAQNEFDNAVINNKEFVSPSKDPENNLIIDTERLYKGKKIIDNKSILLNDVLSFFGRNNVNRQVSSPSASQNTALQSMPQITPQSSPQGLVPYQLPTSQYEVSYNPSSIVQLNYDCLHSVIIVECKKCTNQTNKIYESHTEIHYRRQLYEKIETLLSCQQMELMQQFESLKNSKLDTLTIQQLELETEKLERVFNELKAIETINHVLSIIYSLVTLNKSSTESFGFVIKNTEITINKDVIETINRSILMEGSLTNTCLKSILSKCKLKINDVVPLLIRVARDVVKSLSIKNVDNKKNTKKDNQEEQDEYPRNDDTKKESNKKESNKNKQKDIVK